MTVHFSHHLCLQHSSGPFDRDSARRKPIIDTHEIYKAEFPKSATYDERIPEAVGCQYANNAKEPIYSTNIGDVTCPTCRKEWQGETKRAWDMDKSTRTWLSDEELTIRCWFTCCRHVVLPGFEAVDSPFATDAEERQYLLERRAQHLLNATRQPVFFGIDAVMSIIPDIEKAIATIPEEDRAHLGPFLEEARKADSLLRRARARFEKLDELRAAAALCVQFPKQAKRAA